MTVRIHKDGQGSERHLAGVRFSPPGAVVHRCTAFRTANNFQIPPVLDVPVFSELPIRDQGAMGRCTGETQTRLGEAIILKRTGKQVRLSPLFSYNVGRMEAGVPLTEDSGLMIPDVMAGDEARGICLEEFFPTTADGLTREPTVEARTNALDHRALLYYHCPTAETVIAALQQGFGVSAGIVCYENLMSAECARSGEIKRPEPGERSLGGHNIPIRGWIADKVVDGEKGCFVIDNSWGPDWGCQVFGAPTRGHAYIPRWYIDSGNMSEALCSRGREHT